MNMVAKRVFAWSIVLTGTLLLVSSGIAANLPREFIGVWTIATDADNKCNKSDWKGVGANDSDALISVSAGSVEGWEDGCKISDVKLSGASFEDSQTAEVDLACSGEGMSWRSGKIWHVQTINARKHFVSVRVKLWDERDDFGKLIKGENKKNSVSVVVHVECK